MKKISLPFLIVLSSLCIPGKAVAQCNPNFGPCGPPPTRGGYPGMYREPGYIPPPPPYRVYPTRPDYLREFHEWGGHPVDRPYRPPPFRQRYRPISDFES